MRNRHTRGLTLVEMLVSIVLLGVIVGMGAWMINSARKFWLEEQMRTGAARTSSLWQLQITKELRGVLPAASFGSGLSGVDRTVGMVASLPAARFSDVQQQDLAGKHLDDDTITFATAQVMDSMGRIKPQIVQYRVSRDRANGPIGIVKKIASDPAGLETAQEMLVGRGIISLNCQYMDAKGKWLETWSDKELPRMVKITIGALPDVPGMRADLIYSTNEVFLPAGEEIAR